MSQLSTLPVVVLDDRYNVWGMPAYESNGAAGIDLRACIDETITLGWEKVKLHLGIAAAIPQGHMGILVPRSSTGSKGLELVNTMGVIDSDYRGEIIAWARNKYPENPLEIQPGDRIVQLIIIPVTTFASITYKSSFDPNEDTARGGGGFGSTGAK